MRTFLICPVRGYDQRSIKNIVNTLELDGYDVYYPARDTNQNDNTGYRICCDNMAAIKSADVIHFVWDGSSQGCLFDLGISFALNKKIIPVSMPQLSEGKSFQNMVAEWSKK